MSIGYHPLQPLTTTNSTAGGVDASSTSSKSTSWLCEAIAHPVLLESTRGRRCSYCFTSIVRDDDDDDDCYRRDANDDVDRRRRRRPLHRYCSSKCEDLDDNRIDDERALRGVPSAPSPTALYCSWVLRKFHESTTS
jgi:hypothetical protein